MAWVAAAVGAGTAITSMIVGGIQRRKNEKTAEEIAALQAQAQVSSAYLNLWGTEAMADSNVITGAYGLTTAREYRNIALIAGAAIFSILIITLIGYGFYRVFFKKAAK